MPSDFPAGLAFKLQKAKLKLEVIDPPFYPAREIKGPEEAAALKKGNAGSAAGIRAAEKVLQDSVIKKGKLYYQNKVLSSERLRYFVECACLESLVV